MQELFLAAAKYLPESELINDLQKAITKFQETESDSDRKEMIFYLGLCFTKFATEGKTIQEISKELDERESAVNLMRTRNM